MEEHAIKEDYLHQIEADLISVDLKDLVARPKKLPSLSFFEAQLTALEEERDWASPKEHPTYLSLFRRAILLETDGADSKEDKIERIRRLTEFMAGLDQEQQLGRAVGALTSLATVHKRLVSSECTSSPKIVSNASNAMRDVPLRECTDKFFAEGKAQVTGGSGGSTSRMQRNWLWFSIESEQGAPVDFTKPFNRTFTIRNSTTCALPATATLDISRSACFQPASVVVGEILPGAKKTVVLEHRLIEDVKTGLETIEEFTSYSLKHNGTTLKEFTHQARMVEYSAYLERYRPTTGGHIRILLCGIFGSGKSSFVRSVCTALSSAEMVVDVPTVNPKTDCGTVASGPHQFQTSFCCDALPFFSFIDTWGKEASNWREEAFKNWGILNEEAFINAWGIPNGKEAEGKHKIHSVVLFVPADGKKSNERDTIKMALAKSANTTIVMSLCEPRLTSDELKQFQSNPNLPIQALEAKKAALGIGDVLPVAPYMPNETTKIFERDRLTLRILERALCAGMNQQSFSRDGT